MNYKRRKIKKNKSKRIYEDVWGFGLNHKRHYLGVKAFKKRKRDIIIEFNGSSKYSSK